MPDHGSPDREKILNDILTDYEAKERSASNAAKGERVRVVSRGRTGHIVLGAGIVLILALAAFAVFVLTGDGGLFGEKRYWAAGVSAESGPHLNECIGTLWTVRAAADAYYARHKAFPDDLETLCEAGFLKAMPACPASGKPYVTRIVGGAPIVACPNAASHDARAVWCGMRGGPPVVERE